MFLAGPWSVMSTPPPPARPEGPLDITAMDEGGACLSPELGGGAPAGGPVLLNSASVGGGGGADCSCVEIDLIAQASMFCDLPLVLVFSIIKSTEGGEM